jgi:hypothetical protein
MADKQLGGWYDNPATGRNQRWWGSYGWTDGSDPTGGGGSSGGGSSSGSGSSDGGASDFASLFGQAAASTIEVPPIQVKTWEEYDAIAMEELRPYYERILKEEGGDVEKAKVRLDEDYQRGVRIQREDTATAKTAQGTPMLAGETPVQYYNRTKDLVGEFPTEGTSLFSNLNKRGVTQSGIADVQGTKLRTSQEARQEAIDTALKRYEENAGINKSRTLADTESEWQRRQFALEEEKKTNAATLGRQKRSDEISTQEIERENLLRKAINNTYS